MSIQKIKFPAKIINSSNLFVRSDKVQGLTDSVCSDMLRTDYNADYNKKDILNQHYSFEDVSTMYKLYFKYSCHHDIIGIDESHENIIEEVGQLQFLMNMHPFMSKITSFTIHSADNEMYEILYDRLYGARISHIV